MFVNISPSNIIEKNTPDSTPSLRRKPQSTGDPYSTPSLRRKPQSTDDLSALSWDEKLRLMERCRLSPSEFARNVLGVQLWSKQEEVLHALSQNRRVAVKAGNGLGKGFTAAVAVLWFLSCYAPAIVITTAPTARQVRHILWREIRRLHGASAQRLGGTMLNTRFEIAGDRFALGLSTDEADQFQGFHSPNMLIVVDEAEGVSESIYEAIDAVMTSGNCKLLLIGNPTSDSGSFRRAFHEDRRIFRNITISALESPNVQHQQVIIPGLTTREWVEERAAIWGEENPMYQARVLGQFSKNPQHTLIPLTKIDQAISRHPATSPHPNISVRPEHARRPMPSRTASVHPNISVRPERREQVVHPAAKSDVQPAPEVEGPTPIDNNKSPTTLAVDVARFGTDKSILLLADSNSVHHIESRHGLDTMQLAGHVIDAYRRWSPDRIVVDEIGIGAGVVDRLKELNFPVTGINVARPARQPKLYANLRAEGYWRLHELFNQNAISIPDDPELAGQLSALRHNYNSKGQSIIESKDDTRARGLPSPDKADALMLAFLPRRSVTLHI